MYRVRVREITTSRWTLFKWFLRGRHESGWFLGPPVTDKEWYIDQGGDAH